MPLSHHNNVAIFMALDPFYSYHSYPLCSKKIRDITRQNTPLLILFNHSCLGQLYITHINLYHDKAAVHLSFFQSKQTQ